MHGVLLPAYVSDNANPVQRAGTADGAGDGPFCGWLLPHNVALRLHAHPTRDHA